jgi:hypothetical protein
VPGALSLAVAPDLLGFVSRAVKAAMTRSTNLKRRRTTMSTTEKTESTSSKLPSHIAYHVRGREGEKGFFTRIGAAWPSKDGKGLNIQIDAVPLSGRITLRPALESKE